MKIAIKKKLVLLLLAVVLGIGGFLFFKRDTRDYSAPGYLEYKKAAEYCGGFFGGGKIPNKDKATYDSWKRQELIGC